MKNFWSSLKRDVSDFTTLSPQVKFLLAIQVIILFILSILVGVLFSPKFTSNVQPNPTGPQQEIENAGSTQLSVEPLDHIMKVGESVIMNVNMSGAPASAVDIVLTYDPTLLDISEVVNGDIYEREIVNRVEDGKIYFSAAQPISDSTEGPVFGFVATSLQKTETAAIEFSLEETITAENGINTLGIAQPAQIHVFD